MARTAPEYENGIPVWARNDKGQPICGAKNKSAGKINQRGNIVPEFCQQTRLTGLGRCKLTSHGGKPQGKKPPTPSEVRAVQTREELLKYIAEKDKAGLAAYADVIHESAITLKNTDDAKWMISICVGGPKTSIEISETKVVEAASAAVAELERDLEIPELFEKWLALLTARIGSTSGI